MNNEELKSVYQMFTDSWRFFKEHASIEGDNAYWENVVSESGELSKKHNQCKLVVNLLTAVISELERVYKEKYKK